jgi:hypothetical protein
MAKTPAKSVTPFNWPPEMEAAYRKWEAENYETCLCLNCLQARLRQVQQRSTPKD